MGGWYNSIHIRSDSTDPVMDVLQELAGDGKCRFYLAPPINGWVGVFAKMLPRVRISARIAKKLPQDIIELAVYDDDVFCYWYYRQGKLIDSFNSRPDYFGQPVFRKQRDSLKGRPEFFSDILGDSEKLARLQQIITEVSAPPRTDGIFPRGMEQKLTELGAVSGNMEHLMKKAEKIPEFMSGNPQIFDEHSKMLRELFEKGEITCSEDALKFFVKDPRGKKFIQEILEQYIKHADEPVELELLRKTLPKVDAQDLFAFEDSSGEEVIQEVPVPPEFVSEYMLRFADLLGIQNSLTSYEYLKDGDTDDISRWDEFIEIP